VSEYEIIVRIVGGAALIWGSGLVLCVAADYLEWRNK
jgi:hypothetical protein